MSGLYNDFQMDIYNSQEYKSFEIDAVTMKKSMNECHPLIKCQAYGLDSNTAIYVGK